MSIYMFTLALVFMITRCYALECYECNFCTSYELGQNKTCPSTSNFCQKVRTYGGNLESVQRSCVDTCTESKLSALGKAGTETSCCTTDLLILVKLTKDIYSNGEYFEMSDFIDV
ncbi:unnamed protein product [Brachionus calyciflorus]|uniref:Snake toxin/toxin-like domain-containing protein n=1 Tax=Brachionus calyciflorus TaxID=104777 RepID=A0A813XA05_9BILA|nr:unnamed protein product [Brachionus calyciflorus]